MTRTSAPASADASRVTSPASSAWYAGAIILSLLGRLTHSWMPWNSPPDITSASGGVSMCRIPPPAVIHCVAPSRDQPAPAVGVLVRELAVDHVRHGLEPAVRVPWVPFGSPGCVLDLTHLVHVHERVESAQRHPGERATHREALTLEPGRRRRDRLHHSLGRCCVEHVEARQGQVVGGHGRHRALLVDGRWRGPRPRTAVPDCSRPSLRSEVDQRNVAGPDRLGRRRRTRSMTGPRRRPVRRRRCGAAPR